jgi:gliding motility-associated transport system permease protein
MANGFIKNTATVTRRELSGYFGTPVAYVFIVIYLLLCGFFTFFVARFFETMQADLSAFFQWHPWLYLFLIPAVAMRQWADERRSGTLELILTLPLTLTELIIGKFFAAWLFVGVSLLLTFPLICTVFYLGNPDVGTIFSAYIGSFLMAGAYLSIGCMTSSITRNQIISFIVSVVLCLFLVMAGWEPVTAIFSGWAPSWLIDVVSGFSFLPHFNAMARGIIDARDLLYFVSVISFMLFLNGVILHNRRAT